MEFLQECFRFTENNRDNSFLHYVVCCNFRHDIIKGLIRINIICVCYHNAVISVIINWINQDISYNIHTCQLSDVNYSIPYIRD